MTLQCAKSQSVTVEHRAGGAGGAYGTAQSVHDMLGGLLATVTIEAPPPAEQLAILEALFPALAPLLHHALAMLAVVQGAAAFPGNRSVLVLVPWSPF